MLNGETKRRENDASNDRAQPYVAFFFEGEDATSSEELARFVSERNLTQEELDRFVALACVEQFKRTRGRKPPISVQEIEEDFFCAFQKNDAIFDRTRARRALIRELYQSDEPVDRDELIDDFGPEITQFVDECEKLRRNESTFDDVGEIELSENYRVVARLARGGQKYVFEAVQTSSNQRVALKKLCFVEKGTKNQIGREAQLQSSVSHPNVPPILSLGRRVGSDEPILVEKFIVGKNWGETIDNRSFEANLQTLSSVARVVAFAHLRRCVAHGDLKPENVVFATDEIASTDGDFGKFNEIYVVDWGSSVCVDGVERVRTTTLNYAPPEYFDWNRPTTFAFDVFMLGGILYRILSGAPPYSRTRSDVSRDSFRAAIEAGDFPKLTEIDPRDGSKRPRELLKIVDRATAKNPDERYRDAAEFADALDRWRGRAAALRRLENVVDECLRLPELAEKTESFCVATIRASRVADEATAIRRELSALDPNDEELETAREAATVEATAREILLEIALKNRDLGLCRYHLTEAREASRSFVTLNPLDADVRTRRLDGFEKRLKSAENERRRTRFFRRLAVGFAVVATFFFATSTFFLNRSACYLATLNDVEREMTPYSVAVSYVDNFLRPTLERLVADGDETPFVVALPFSLADLEHAEREKMFRDVAQKRGLTKREFKIDRSVENQRSLTFAGFAASSESAPVVYFDSATQTSAFGETVAYKKTQIFWQDFDEDRALNEYSRLFAETILKRLEKNATPEQAAVLKNRIRFVYSSDEWDAALADAAKPK